MPFALPEHVSVYNLGTLIELKNAIVASGDSKIVIEASKLHYIDPAGLCVLIVRNLPGYAPVKGIRFE